jgi:hypothetical protein
MLYDLTHSHVSLSDWQTFDKEFSPLIDEVIDREEAKLPNWLVPVAHGVFTASNALLRTAGHRDGMRHPPGWRESDDDVYIRDVDPVDSDNCRWLLVRQCFVDGLWMVERWTRKRRYAGSDEILVHEFGSTPIFTRSCPSAMRLAMHCHVKGPPAGLRWIAASPDD